QRSNRLENAAFPHGVVDDAILLVRRLLIDDAHLVGARLRLRRMELERKRDGNGGIGKQVHRKGLRGPLAHRTTQSPIFIPSSIKISVSVCFLSAAVGSTSPRQTHTSLPHVPSPHGRVIERLRLPPHAPAETQWSWTE